MAITQTVAGFADLNEYSDEQARAVLEQMTDDPNEALAEWAEGVLANSEDEEH